MGKQSLPTPDVRGGEDGGGASTNILGVVIDAVTPEMATSKIERWILERARKYVAVCNVHTIMEAVADPAYQAALNGAGIRVPDGMPLVWISRRRGKPWVERVYGPELFLRMSAIAAERGYKFFLYGGMEGVADRLRRNLEERFPGLQVVGTHCPPFRPLTEEEDRIVIDEINRSGADIVWVGLGTPKQDFWAASHVGRLDVAAIICVGAAFDFFTGRVRQAPHWMQRSGLEWLFRLLQEPRRLWRRYLLLNPLFVMRVAVEEVGLRVRRVASRNPGLQPRD